jgi:hypothetical protein
VGQGISISIVLGVPLPILKLRRYGSIVEAGSADAAYVAYRAIREELEAEIAKTGGDPITAYARIQQRNADALIKDALQRWQAGENNWETLVHGLGRNHMPFLLLMVWNSLAGDQQVKALSDAWTSAEFPERHLLRKEWLQMFREVGYHDEHQPAIAPEQVTLWRGGVKKSRMSWTADRERAVWFQHRPFGKPGKLWKVTVDRERLLAHYHELHRGEDEYVIDPTGLRPTEIR